MQEWLLLFAYLHSDFHGWKATHMSTEFETRKGKAKLQFHFCSDKHDRDLQRIVFLKQFHFIMY